MKKKNLKKDLNYNLLFVLSLIVAFFIRLFLADKASFLPDMMAFKKAMTTLVFSPWKEYYNRVEIFEVGYLPVIPMILFFLGKVYQYFLNPSFSFLTELDSTILVLLKMPPILFDLLIGGLIYLLLFKDKRKAFLTSLIFLFNPSIIYLSSLWGQYGSLYIFFLFLSTYFLINKNYKYGLLSLSTSFLVKPQTLIVFPVFYLISYLKLGIKKFIKYLIISFIPFVIILPFSQGNPVVWLWNYIGKLNSPETTKIMVSSAFNFWSLVADFNLSVDHLFLGISLRLWGLLIFAVFYTLLLTVCLRRVIRKQYIDFYFYLALVFLTFFLFAPQVHERYLLSPVAFLCLISLKNKKYLLFYLVLSIVFIANLAFVLEEFLPIAYYFKTFGLLGRLVIGLSKNNGLISSFISLFVFVILLKDFFFLNKKNNLLKKVKK